MRPPAAAVAEDLRKQWVTGEERLVMVSAPRPGYAVSAIGSTVQTPHEPLGPVEATMKLSPRQWPLPSVPASEGLFRGDDWLSDPTLVMWVTAEDPTRDAVRVADHFVAGMGEAALVLTNQRFAVLVPEKLLGKPPNSNGFFGKAKAVARSLTELPYWTAGDKIVSIWEVDADRIRGVGQRLAGRDIPPRQLAVVDFLDGSQLRVRDLKPVE